jgi:S1-C subfamily serine protease
LNNKGIKMKELFNSLRTKLKLLYGAVERSLGPITKTAIGLCVIGALGLLTHKLLADKSEITNSTVMITSMNERGGGSGSVISSEEGKSTVLTNGHVCEVAVNGGLVKTNTGQKHTIVEFRKSKVHDLCLITVSAKLPGKVTLASESPQMYELATVSGHPALLPNVVTQGHFSGNKIIDVFLGMRECTEKEMKDENLGFVCFFFGGLPQIRTYEAVLVTATIMPGSSGSAIYNSSKELSAVVFAGSGEIGYAFAVPYEYVRNFLNEEVSTIRPSTPNYELDVLSILKQENKRKRRILDIEEKCKSGTTSIGDVNQKQQIERMCDVITRDSSWRSGL